MATVDFDTVLPGELPPVVDETTFPSLSPKILSGAYVITGKPWSLPERIVDNPAANCPWNPNPDAATPSNPFIIEPRANLVCFRFGGQGTLGATVRLNTRFGSRQAEALGTYTVRKNTWLQLVDGFLTVRIPDFGAINEFYFIRRTRDELDLIMLASRTSSGVAMPNVLNGTLKRVRRTHWLDWLS